MARALSPLVLAAFLVPSLHAQEPLPNHYLVNAAGAFQAGGYGTNVAAVGDLDGDGFEDYAVSAPSYDAGAGPLGRVYLHSGRTSYLLRVLDGDQAGAGFGDEIAGAGDLTGDGVLDVLVSSPGWDHPVVGNNVGRVACFSGATGAIVWQAAGDQVNAAFGESLGILGSPGAVSSVVVGQPGWSSPALSACGRVLYLAPASGLIQFYEEGLFNFDGMGRTLALRGGLAALFAGSGGGRVFQLVGPGGGAAPPTVLLPPLAGSNDAPELIWVAGASASSTGLVVGRPKADTNGLINNGQILFFGPNAVLPAPVVEGAATNEQIGLRLAVVRDLDGDGDEEVGSASGPPAGFSDIRYRVFSLSGGLLLDYVSPGAAPARFASIADVTGDGRGEVLQATASGLSQRFDCRLLADGLSFTSLATLPTGALHYVHAIDMGPGNAGATYLQLYSATNYAPGFVYAPGAPIVPVFPDILTDLLLMEAGGPLYPDAIGFLDGAGTGQTNAYVDAVAATMFSGASFWSAVAVLDVPGATIAATTNPVTITLP